MTNGGLAYRLREFSKSFLGLMGISCYCWHVEHERGSNGNVPELDGLRGVALLLVLLRHFGEGVPTSTAGRMVYVLTQGGWIGVDLFFVLSGFLITGICLDHRGPGLLRTFYARRALRILPVYATLLTVVAAVSLFETGALPTGLLWLATFTTTIAQAATGKWNVVPGYLTHLWSLAVEEQFYIVWPAIVLLLNDRRTLITALALFPLALLLRGIIVAHHAPAVTAYVLMPARMDALAIGAMLALLWRSPDQQRTMRQRLSPIANASIAAWVCFAITVCVVTSLAPGGQVVMQTVGYSLIACTSGLVLASVLSADPVSPLCSALRSTTLRRIGKYSYAMYLVHYPLRALIALTIGSPVGAPAVIGTIVLGGTLTYFVAALSWRVIEKPCVSLKRFVPYARESSHSVQPTVDGERVA